MPPVIVMTAHATVTRAVEAMKCGAYDFLLKPLNMEHLTLAIGKAIERESLKQQVEYLRTEVESRYSVIVGKSPKMTTLTNMAKRAANSDATVLLLGESGTGKELFARSIHQWSPRRKQPFVIINCVALNDTLCLKMSYSVMKRVPTLVQALNKKAKLRLPMVEHFFSMKLEICLRIYK